MISTIKNILTIILLLVLLAEIPDLSNAIEDYMKQQTQEQTK